MGKKFTIQLIGSVTLTEKEIWPNGDAPENPTIDHVRALAEEYYGVAEFLEEWGLENDFTLDITAHDVGSSEEKKSTGS